MGDHGLEYMTGGVAVILGETGRNFAAGMSGGVAYIWDKNADFAAKVNTEMVNLETLTSEDLGILKSFIEKHFQHTTSAVALQILQSWDQTTRQFVKVMPADFKAALASRNIKLADQIANKKVVYKDIVVDVSQN